MERKNIAFQYGIHRSPSTPADGELAECINVEAHNAELTPSVMPEISFSLQEGDKLLFVHTSGNYKNFIIQRGNELCWLSDSNKENAQTIGQITPTSIHSVGNTLVVLSHDRMEYVLFKSGSYKRIGSKPPFCSISFGLTPGERRTGFNEIGEFTIEGAASDVTDAFVGFKDGIKQHLDEGTEPKFVSYLDRLDEIETDNPTSAAKYVKAMTESITPKLNKLVDDNRKYGKFMHPFFVRYAYRLYDGSHYMQSAPIFMPVNMKGAVVLATSYRENGYDFTCNYRIDFDICDLDYKIVAFVDENGDSVSEEVIKEWEDIIEGIDIYASQPIYPYKQDGYFYGYWGTTPLYGSNLVTTGRVFDIQDLSKVIYKNRLYSSDYPTDILAFMSEVNPEFTNQIKNTSLFYKISEFKSISSLTEEMERERQALPIKKDTLTALEQQEKLEDDYDSHDSIIPSFAHVYNGRLNIGKIKTRLFAGFPMESMVPYTYDEAEIMPIYHVRATLEIEGTTCEVISHSNIVLHEQPGYIYYPKAKCKSFTIIRAYPEILRTHQYLADAEVHKLLNGSFYLSESFGVNDSYQNDYYPKYGEPPYIEYPNKLYTSEVNNPFFFPLSGRNSIGVGEIVAISSNSKAISPGQFGQYPLIVFSTDGVWAMQVGTEGLYESLHPISKDICNNPNVLQTDGPIIFSTHNGLRSVMAENVTDISKVMKGRPEQVIIPEIDEQYTYLANAAVDRTSFNEFIEGAFFADDYINNRAVIFNPQKDYAYIYCLDCGMFSKMVMQHEGNPVRFESVIRAYPEVYMQSGQNIYTFVPDRDKADGKVSKGIIVTRPLSFADPLALKVINQVKLVYRKTSEDTQCRYVMYVSNDGLHWARRNTLRGHSHKYFRFVIFTEMADTDSLAAMSVIFDYRRTARLR